MVENTSWEKVSEWYGKAVGEKGLYYHQHIIIPKSLKMLALEKGSALLDMACGQGILARQIPEGVSYIGVDVAPALIEQAKRLDKNREHIFLAADVCKELPIETKNFSHATVILSLQNIKEPEKVVQNAWEHLKRNGRFLIVLNHPCFRIPRQTRWEMDEQSKIQYRRIDTYMTPLRIPLAAFPSKGSKSVLTWSYHFPISEYSRMLFTNGFVIEKIEEWISDKQSVGEAAKKENRARREFPLFMAVLARKT